MVVPGFVALNALSKMKSLTAAALFWVVNFEAVFAKLIEPKKLAVIPTPEPAEVRPKL